MTENELKKLLDKTSKSEIRKEMRLRRREVTPEERARASAAICRTILERSDVAAARDAKHVFAVYLASPEEIDLSPLIEELSAVGVPLAAPRWNGSIYTLSRLDGIAGGEFALRAGPHGIPEPAEDRPVEAGEVAVWIVPGLAFTQEGGRLGYGGGWYDCFLAAAKPEALVLGVAYPFQLVKYLPSEPHDRKICDIICANYELP